jgi:hypothetical protein
MQTILTTAERELLLRVLHEVPRAIVWDVNAVYFVLANTTIKVEASAETPVPSFPDQEVMCIRTSVVSPAPHFLRKGEPPHWYRVMCENEPVVRLEIIRAAVRIPREEVVATDDPAAIIADVGVLVHTRLGIIPAVQLDNAFGFQYWPGSREWALPAEVESRISPEYVRSDIVLVDVDTTALIRNRRVVAAGVRYSWPRYAVGVILGGVALWLAVLSTSYLFVSLLLLFVSRALTVQAPESSGDRQPPPPARSDLEAWRRAGRGVLKALREAVWEVIMPLFVIYMWGLGVGCYLFLSGLPPKVLLPAAIAALWVSQVVAGFRNGRRRTVSQH